MPIGRPGPFSLVGTEPSLVQVGVVVRSCLCVLLLLFASDARALVVDRASISVDPAHTDTVTLGGRFESLTFAKLETLQIVLDGFAYEVPVTQIKFKKSSFKYTSKKGQPGIRTLSVDLKKRRFKVALAEILIGTPGSPLVAQIVSNEGGECAVVPLFEKIHVTKPGADPAKERRRKRKLKLAKVPPGTSGACAVVGLKLTPPALLLGDPGTIVATVAISAGVDAGSAQLFRADAIGFPEGDPLCTLSDDGKGGDVVAGDGTYACTIQVDTSAASRVPVVASATIGGARVRSARGVLQVLTPLSAADAQTIVDVQAQADAIWNANKAAYGDGEKARVATAAALRIDLRIESVTLAEPLGSIGIVYASGVLGGLGLTPRISSAGEAQAATARAADAMIAPAAATLPPDNAVVVGNPRVLIWDPGFFGILTEVAFLRDTFTKSTCPHFDVTVLQNGAATLATLQTLPTYGTVALVTHGDLIDKDRDHQFNIMRVKEEATAVKLLDHADALQHGQLVVTGDNLGITPDFVRNLPGAFKDGVMWGGYCYSGINADSTGRDSIPNPKISIDSLADAYAAKGVRAHIGFTRAVDTVWAIYLAKQMTPLLLSGGQTTQATFNGVEPKWDYFQASRDDFLPHEAWPMFADKSFLVAHLSLLPAGGKPLVYLKPTITPKNSTVESAGQIALDVTVEGADTCTLQYRWRNSGTVGHLNGGDDTTTAEATRTYTATNATKGKDTITVDVIDTAAVPKRTLFTLTTTVAIACHSCSSSLRAALGARAADVCPLHEACCEDNQDNDGDGLIDCEDPDCAADPACATERIFYSVCTGPDYLGQGTSHSMKPDGSDQQQIGVGGSWVRVSPDGTRLATVTSATTVSTARLDGSDRHDITLESGSVTGNLAWSPDGKSIVVAVLGTAEGGGGSERQLQTSPDRTGTTDGVWHLGPLVGQSVDWVGGNWLFTYSYDGASGLQIGVASAPALSEGRVTVFDPYSTAGFSPAGNVRFRPDGTPSWSGLLNGAPGLIVNGVLWLGTPAFGIPAYSPDGLWVAAAHPQGVAVFKFDGSEAYNASATTNLCGLDWGRAVGLPPAP